jgi:hypothetical protein
LGRGISLDSTLSVLASCIINKEKKKETEVEVGEALGRIFDIKLLGKIAIASTDSVDTSGRTVGETISAYFSPPPTIIPRYVDSLTYAFGCSVFLCRIIFCDTLVIIFFK